MSSNLLYTDINIRATSLKDFWGEGYGESIYLWEGSKNYLTLSEIAEIDAQTFPDAFPDVSAILSAYEYCKLVYIKILPRVATVLNKISGLNLSTNFWRTALAFFLFRHISNIYEKYTYLSKIDIDNTSIKLLNIDSYYIPINHYEYVGCFCNDFGVQQNVSLYYELFKKNEFPYIQKTFEINKYLPYLNKSIYQQHSPLNKFYKLANEHIKNYFSAYKRFFRKNIKYIDPKIALLGLSATPKNRLNLYARSSGNISPIQIPTIKNSNMPNLDKRKEILNITVDNNFEYYLVQSLFYCIPQLFVEHFDKCHFIFSNHIDNKKFTHIVSENWISNIFSSIYVAIAQDKGKKFIAHEHGSGAVFDSSFSFWIQRMTADRCITVGWDDGGNDIVRGGFIARDIKTYQFSDSKRSILYVARTNFPYLNEFMVSNYTNTKSMSALKRIRKFIDILPSHMLKYFIFRPRRVNGFWDTEHTLEVHEKNITICTGDAGDFSKGIDSARIVVIDHISTGFAEILLRKVPFILLQNSEHDPPVLDEINNIFRELTACGVIHTTPESAVSHLELIYDNVEKWWTSDDVQEPITRLRELTLGPPSQTIDYLLSLCKM